MLTFSVVITETATEFDDADYARRLATLISAPVSDIEITTPLPQPSFGLRVTATIYFLTVAESEVARTILARLTPAAMSMKLGVTIIRVEGSTVAITVRFAPSVPPPESSPTPLAPPPATASPSMPPAPSLTLIFLAPNHVSSHILSTKWAIQSVFASAFHLPSIWLHVTLTEDTVTNVKAGAGMKLFVMIIEITSAHLTMDLLVTMRRVIGDNERLAHLLSTAVPGATLVPTSIEPPPPPPLRPPSLPRAPPKHPPTPMMWIPGVGRAPYCDEKLCPIGFKCPAGSLSTVPDDQGTNRPVAACVKVARAAEGDTQNTSKSASENGDLASEEENITSDEEDWFGSWIVILAGIAAVALCCCAGCVVFALRQEKKRVVLKRLAHPEDMHDAEAKQKGGTIFVKRAQEGRLEVRKDGDRRSSKAERPLPDLSLTPQWFGNDVSPAARLRRDSDSFDPRLNPDLANPAERSTLTSPHAQQLTPRLDRLARSPYAQGSPSVPSGPGSDAASSHSASAPPQRWQSRLGPEASSLHQYPRQHPSSANMLREGMSQRGPSQERLVLQALSGGVSRQTGGGAMPPNLELPSRRLSSTPLAASSMQPHASVPRRNQPTQEHAGSSPGWDRL